MTKLSIDLRWMFYSCPSCRFGIDGYSSGEVGFMIVLLAAILAFVAGGTSLLKTSRGTSSSLIYQMCGFNAVVEAFVSIRKQHDNLPISRGSRPTRRSETVFFNRRLRFWLWLRGPKVILVADANEVQHDCQQLCRIVMLSTTK